MISIYIRGFAKFGIKVAWRLQFLEYFRTLRLEFQKARTKIEVVLALPCWLSQLNWDSQQGRASTTSILPSEILNLRSSNTQETVDFTPPWYKEFLKNPESATARALWAVFCSCWKSSEIGPTAENDSAAIPHPISFLSKSNHKSNLLPTTPFRSFVQILQHASSNNRQRRY